MDTMNIFDHEINELEEKLSKARKKKDEFSSLPENYKLAEILHRKLCTNNHLDGCFWFYSDWEKYKTNPKSSDDRRYFVERANKLLSLNISLKDIISIINNL